MGYKHLSLYALNHVLASRNLRDFVYPDNDVSYLLFRLIDIFPVKSKLNKKRERKSIPCYTLSLDCLNTMINKFLNVNILARS